MNGMLACSVVVFLGTIGSFILLQSTNMQIGQCQTRLAVRPQAGKAVLFYSQHPDGSKDEDSLHAACPVLVGDKWAGKCLEKFCRQLRFMLRRVW